MTQPTKHKVNSTRCQHLPTLCQHVALLLRAGPLGRLEQRLRAVAEGNQGHGAAGMPKPHAGRHAFWWTATCATLSVGVSKWWLGRVLACFARRARLSMVLALQHGEQQCQYVLTQPTKHQGNFGASSTRCQHFVNILSTLLEFRLKLYGGKRGKTKGEKK